MNALDVGIMNPQHPSETGTSNRPEFGSSGWPFGGIWRGGTIESLTASCMAAAIIKTGRNALPMLYNVGLKDFLLYLPA